MTILLERFISAAAAHALLPSRISDFARGPILSKIVPEYGSCKECNINEMSLLNSINNIMKDMQKPCHNAHVLSKTDK